MKKLIYLTISILILSSSCKNKTFTTREELQKKLKEVSGSLVPKQPGTTPSYWCTWGAQNYAVDSITISNSTFGVGDHSVLAAKLTEKNVFGEKGWAKAFTKVKKDLYIMFDLGWDIPSNENFDDSQWKLGSQIVATDKFPSCTGTPVEKLKKLNELTKAAGWRGAGIWIPAHAYLDNKNNKLLSQPELEKFFTEKAEWANEAEIEYWKVDYGIRGGDLEFRKMLTRIAKENAPKLYVEHARGGGPLNDWDCPWDCPSNRTGEYTKWCDGLAFENSVKLTEFSQILRTYDVTPYLSVPTTLDRVSQILAKVSGKIENKCILNCEDEPYLAATLNCMMGIMRSPAWIKVQGYNYDPLNLNKRSDEVIRAVRWQRIAPAMGAGEATTTLSANRLTDTWLIKKGDTWTSWLYDKEVKQSAPAIVAKNMPLPLVTCKVEAPYILASKHINGAITLTSLLRHDANKGFYFPLADVSIEIGESSMPIAIFGRFKNITLMASKPMNNCKIVAQDLAGDRSFDITEFVEFSENKIILSGLLLETIGLLAATSGDESEPGLVLKINENYTNKKD